MTFGRTCTQSANLDRVEEALSSCLDQGRRLTVGLLLSLHGMLLEGVPEEPKRPKKPGRLRDYTDEMSAKGVRHLTTHMPPAWGVEAELTSLLDDVESGTLPSGDHGIGCFHYRFVRIHPFCDGNGRMARALCTFLQARQDPETLGFDEPINEVLLEHRENYISVLEFCDEIYESLKKYDIPEQDKLMWCEQPFSFFYAAAVLYSYDVQLVRLGRRMIEAGYSPPDVVELELRPRPELTLDGVKALMDWVGVAKIQISQGELRPIW